ncbi:MAG: 3-phosphoshikimate 1-carboxyvinyltransferase [Pseudomonadota bacterium]
MTLVSHPVRALRGAVRAPGDKSCSHRALIFGALAEGRSRFAGLLEGDDVRRTAAAMQALGAELEQSGPGDWAVRGVGAAGFRTPAGPIDFGNSGTGARLIMGALAGFDLEADLQGDESLSSRPMARVLDPLRRMGAVSEPADADRLPFRLRGRSTLSAIDYAPAQASAQVKSAILIAGLRAEGATSATEAKPTRDHTERMLRGFGVEVSVRRTDAGDTITVEGGQKLSAIETALPGDPSSAAFLTAAAIISPAGEVLIERLMSNDRRDGFYQAAAAMGAHIGAEEAGEAAGERLIDLTAAAGALRGVALPERLVPSMIDEFPILAVLAAFAEGETVVSGAEELRVKESDRVTATVDMLRACGVEAEERPDGFVVQGCGGPPPGGGLVETRHDHRIAMSALVLGTAAEAPVAIDDASMIATSYPDFADHMRALGADIRHGAP